jgi:hypothetical protein
MAKDRGKGRGLYTARLPGLEVHVFYTRGVEPVCNPRVYRGRAQMVHSDEEVAYC